MRDTHTQKGGGRRETGRCFCWPEIKMKTYNMCSACVMRVYYMLKLYIELVPSFRNRGWTQARDGHVLLRVVEVLA